MNDKQNKKLVVVLGAGRAGTSLVMQVLKKLGLTLSQNLVPPKAHNKFGPMEDADIAKIYDNLLYQVGSTRFLPISMNMIPDKIRQDATAGLKKIVKENLNASASIWGFKDPFTSCLLPLWHRIFNSTEALPVFILAVRNPSHATISRNKHFGTLESVGELVWLLNYTEALHHTAGDCYIVHYEDWFTRGEEMAEELLAYTGLHAYFLKENIGEMLQEVVDKKQNRSIFEDYEVQNEYVNKLYKILKDCHGQDFNREELMQVVKECRIAMQGFQGWYQHAQKVIHQFNEIQKEMSKPQDNPVLSMRQIRRLKSDLEKLTLQNNDYLIETKGLREEVSALKMSEKYLMPENEIIEFKNQLKRHKNKISVLQTSYSFRLGQLLVDSFSKPGRNTLLFPKRFIKLVFNFLFARK